jgi:hypothetical protein
MSKGKNENTWVVCPECKTKLKQENLSSHLRYVHDKKIEDFNESSIKVLPKKEQKKKKSTNLPISTIAIIIVILAVSIGAAFFVLSQSSDVSNNDNNGGDSYTPPEWLADYTPEHSVGTGSDNFWINFPAGQSVQHKTWITESLEEKPVFFVCHRTGCPSCTPQADRVKALGKIYGEDAVFYDLDDDYAGTATADILEKYNAAFYYDPNGGINYIALTGVFTLVNDGGEVKIGWHSWEGDVGDSEMESWVKDIIYYYHVNK